MTEHSPMPDEGGRSTVDGGAGGAAGAPPMLLSLPGTEAPVPALGIPADAALRIDRRVATLLDAVMSAEAGSDDFRRRADDIGSIGEAELSATSELSSRLLQRPVSAGALAPSVRTPIARGLLDLGRTVETLNPSRYNLSRSGSRRLLGLFSAGGLQSYAERSARAQSYVQGIVRTLRDGVAELERDNSALLVEARALWGHMEALRQHAYMADRLDVGLEARIAALEATDPQKAQVLRNDALFPLRRRRQEILTQLAVFSQGYAALRIVERNNRELMRVVRTTTTTTVAALRTSIMVAHALANQRLVTDQVRAVSALTSGMVTATSTLLREQSQAVAEQSAAPPVDLRALETAWDNVVAAIQRIDSYRSDALRTLDGTVQQLTEHVGSAQAAAERLRAGAPEGEAPPAGADSWEVGQGRRQRRRPYWLR